MEDPFFNLAEPSYYFLELLQKKIEYLSSWISYSSRFPRPTAIFMEKWPIKLWMFPLNTPPLKKIYRVFYYKKKLFENSRTVAFIVSSFVRFALNIKEEKNCFHTKFDEFFKFFNTYAYINYRIWKS